jgi:hypothetical protein
MAGQHGHITSMADANEKGPSCLFCHCAEPLSLLHTDGVCLCNGQTDGISHIVTYLHYRRVTNLWWSSIEIKCSVCCNACLYDLGHNTDNVLVCRRCLSVAPGNRATLKTTLTSFTPVVLNNMISPLLVRPPTQEYPVTHEQINTILGRRNQAPEQDGGNLPHLEPIPLQYAKASDFVKILREFVREEIRTEQAKRRRQRIGNLSVIWTDSSTFDFRPVGIGQITEGVEVLVKKKRLQFDGVVTAKSRKGIVTVKLTNGPATQRWGTIDLAILFNECPYRRQLTALKQFTSVDPFWQALLLGDLSNGGAEAKFNITMKRIGSDFGVKLNKNQRQAIFCSLNHSFAVIQGPPGTGKSTCAAVQAVELAKQDNSVLVVTRSNEAANNLLRKIEEGWPDVVRVVGRNYEMRDIPDDILKHCSHKIAQTYDQEKEVIERARIVVATTACSGGPRFSGFDPKAVIVDESNQLLDCELAVCLRFHIKRLTLYGDHAQIGPYVNSNRAKALGYGISFCQRVAKLCGGSDQSLQTIMLTPQYRMHPELALFPSREFYGGRVYTGIAARERESLYEFPNPRVPMLFVDVASREQKSSDGVSTLNLMETLRVAEIVNKLAAVGVSADQISVITFYAAAVEVAREMLPHLVDHSNEECE